MGHQIIFSLKIMTTKFSKTRIVKTLNAKVLLICIVQEYQSLMITILNVQRGLRYSDVNVLPVLHRGSNKKM